MRYEESCGRSKEVRIPELIGQIKNFMDEESRVSLETIGAQFDVNYSRGTEDEDDLRKVFPRVLTEDQKERRCLDSREIVELINSNPTVLDALVTCNESWVYCCDL